MTAENPARTTLPKETEWQRRQRRDRERAAHVAAHGPACQICGNVPKRGLDQDHDHRTGRTRGWLCHRCNRALPTWVDVPWLFKTARYLGADAYDFLEQAEAIDPYITWDPEDV